MTGLDAALKTCEELARNRIMNVFFNSTGKRDGVGVMLYCVKDKQNNEDEDESDDEDEGQASQESKTELLIDIAVPNVSLIKGIQECLPAPIVGRRRDLVEEYVDAKINDYKLHEVINNANKAFSNAQCVKKTPAKGQLPDSKAIWILTNQDNPHQDDNDAKRRLLTQAQDAKENGTEIYVWPLSSNFDGSLVYDEIAHVYEPPKDLQELLDALDTRAKKPRRTLTIPMFLPGTSTEDSSNPGIALDFYKLIQTKSKPKPVTINQNTKRRTEVVTKKINQETGEVLAGEGAAAADDRIVKFATIGTDRIQIHKDDPMNIRKANNGGATSGRLLLRGFKPINAIPMTHTIGSAYFAYPVDDYAKGSKKAFANLHAAMLRKKVLAIAEFVARPTTSSRLVSVIPQSEQFAEDEYQILPPGMLVCTLPYEDDTRSLKADVGDTATQESVDAALNLIRKQKFDERIEIGYHFENP